VSHKNVIFCYRIPQAITVIFCNRIPQAVYKTVIFDNYESCPSIDPFIHGFWEVDGAQRLGKAVQLGVMEPGQMELDQPW
jgi:hypothetical protein